MWEMQFQLASLERYPSCPVPGFSTKNLKSLRRWSQVITRSRPSWSGVMFLFGIFSFWFHLFLFLISLIFFFIHFGWICHGFVDGASSTFLFNFLLMLWWTLNFFRSADHHFQFLYNKFLYNFENNAKKNCWGHYVHFYLLFFLNSNDNFLFWKIVVSLLVVSWITTESDQGQHQCI